jgi:hypothetical protein
MQDNNLALPMSIKSKLHQYRNLIPADYNAFVEFGNELYPDFLNYTGNQFDFGAGWYQKTAETYEESKALAIEQALSDIIIYYYGSDCFELETFLTPEFSFPTRYCTSNTVDSLPINSDNAVSGNWFPNVIDISEPGEYELVFIPDLDECSEEINMTVEVNEAVASIVGETHICQDASTILYADDSHASYNWMLDGQALGSSDSVIVSQGGLISLLVVDDNGCHDEAQVSIIQNEPIDLAIDVTHPQCDGDYGAATFEAAGGSGLDYVYSIDGDSLLAGTYTVIVTDDVGCSAMFDFEVEQAMPIVIEVVDNEVIVTGGTEPYLITIDTSGTFQEIMVEDANGCQASEVVMLTGINEGNFGSIRLFPNPATEKIYLDFTGMHSKVQSIQLLSINGQLIRKYGNQDSILDVSQINNGVYLLQIYFENGLRINRRIFVLHK